VHERHNKCFCFNNWFDEDDSNDTEEANDKEDSDESVVDKELMMETSLVLFYTSQGSTRCASQQ
jgi:hypothetical protein